MYNMVNTDVICPECGEGRMIREEPKIIKSNTERYAYLCPDCGFVHTAKSDEDMKEWIKSLDKIIEEENFKETRFCNLEEAPSKCLNEHCEHAEVFKDKLMCMFYNKWFDLTPVDKEGKKAWPPEDPVDIHDEISKGFTRIEKVMREESAKIAEIIRQAVVEYPYRTAAHQVVWTNYIPEACRSCTNHPSNGGTGICHCTLGSPNITCNATDFTWKEDVK